MTKGELSATKRALLERWLKGDLENSEPNIPRRPPNSPIQLSFSQQRQLFLELLDRGTAVNNLSVFIELSGRLDLETLEKSANLIFARHDVLRTRYSFGQGLPAPEVITNYLFTLPIVDLQQYDLKESEATAHQLAEEDVLKPFNLTQAPLLRLKLFAINPEKHLLLLVVHHTIADGWSLGVFLRELIFYYRSISSEDSGQLAALLIQYTDFAHWQIDEEREKKWYASMRYWKKQLDGDLPVLELPTDQPRGARQTFSGGTHRFVLDPEIVKALEAFNRTEDVTLFMTLVTVFCILLYRYSSQRDVLIGTPVANRDLPELEHLIGVFINTIVLRTNVSGDPSFRELLKQVRDVSLGAYAHQNLPFEKLVEELKPQRDLSRTPLFQVAFNLQNSPMPKLEIPGVEIKFVDIDRGVSQFDLTLMITKLGEKCHASVEYNSDLFQSSTISGMFDSYQLLLKDAIDQPNQPISRLPLIREEELHKLIFGLNDTAFEYPRKKNVHQLFEEQAEKSPEAQAVVYDDTSISYRALNHRANALARHLHEIGVDPGTRVGILMEKSLEIPEALLGVLKSGGVYVPIYNAIPIERLKFIVKDAHIKVILTNTKLSPLKGYDVRIVNMKEEKFLSTYEGSNLSTRITPHDLAYIIYTSGSTGRPKGVMIQHLPLINFLWSMRDSPGFRKGDVLLAVTSISFDIAALELFLPLVSGGTVVIASRAMMNNPILLGQAIERYQVDVMQATPATWQLLLDTGWKGKTGLKALCGGDTLTKSLAHKLLDHVESLWNMYGPTETTIWSSIGQIHKNGNPITIGKPINNTQLYILDCDLQAVPKGVFGELHIGGDGLALGYLNQHHLSEEKFIPDCFSSKAGARLYKTGDLARYLSDYSIEHLGRKDFQVKIHGHRIELGEIETVLTQYRCIREAIAISRTEPSGEKRIVVYYVPTPDEFPKVSELRAFISKSLPAYMVPAVFIQLKSFPLTANGKIDRSSLPVPEDGQKLNEYVAPRNEKEKILVRIWQDSLDIEQVGIHDNFFDLGGASIQSLEIVAKANTFGLRFNVEAIFEYQTIAALAEQISAK